MKIVFPDYPTKIAMTKGRRKKFYHPGDPIPLKYRNDKYVFKKNKLIEVSTGKPVIRNAGVINKPRYQSLSYNKISTQLKIPVLIKLKEWMDLYMPASITEKLPLRIRAYVYDWPIPLEKDLDNMHIYYKAFLDLMKQRGMIPGDSKRYISEAGGFTFIPIYHEQDRKLVFDIKHDDRAEIAQSLMYNLKPRKVLRGNGTGILLVESKDTPPGELVPNNEVLLMNMGKTKVIKRHADKLFRAVFDYCLNHNTPCTVGKEFYRDHSDRIQKFLLDRGIPVYINPQL